MIHDYLKEKLNINLLKIIQQYVSISIDQVKINRKNLNFEYQFVFKFPIYNKKDIFEIIKLNNECHFSTNELKFANEVFDFNK
jgi:hypothetical protein